MTEERDTLDQFSQLLEYMKIDHEVERSENPAVDDHFVHIPEGYYIQVHPRGLYFGLNKGNSGVVSGGDHSSPIKVALHLQRLMEQTEEQETT